MTVSSHLALESQYMSFHVTMQLASYSCPPGLKSIQQCIMPKGLPRVSVCLVSLRQHSGYTSQCSIAAVVL